MRPFSPQYPLWTDGARKRRYIRLPPRARIDVRDPDRWDFPVGTRVWKEFSFGDRPIETRYLERTAAGWRYAVYAWSESGDEATLAPAGGIPRALELEPGIFHAVPGEADCRTCHDNGGTPVLGFSALQLSDDRDPLAPHAEPLVAGALTLSTLADERLIAPPDAFHGEPPRIRAATPEARAALGYLHGNCGHCHTSDGPLASVGLELFQRVSSASRALESTVAVPSRFLIPGEEESLRVAPGRPESSALAYRLSATDPFSRMPPLGTRLVDREAIAVVERWIASLQSHPNHGAVP